MLVPLFASSTVIWMFEKLCRAMRGRRRYTILLSSFECRDSTHRQIRPAYYHTSHFLCSSAYIYAPIYCGILEDKNHIVLCDKIKAVWFFQFVSFPPSLAQSHSISLTSFGRQICGSGGDRCIVFYFFDFFLLYLFTLFFLPNRTLHFGFFFARDSCV